MLEKGRRRMLASLAMCCALGAFDTAQAQSGTVSISAIPGLSGPDSVRRRRVAELAARGPALWKANRLLDLRATMDTALTISPFDHDALFYATLVEWRVQNNQKPYYQYHHLLVRRLLAIAPNSWDGWLMQLAVNGKLKDSSDVTVASLAADSATYYDNKLSKTTPDPQVNVMRWNTVHGDASTALAEGTVTNRSPRAQAYRVVLEFLDIAGAPVASRSVEVAPVDPDSSRSFRALADDPRIMAVRYRVEPGGGATVAANATAPTAERIDPVPVMSPEELYAFALNAKEQERFDVAIIPMRQAAERGHPAAQQQLAEMMNNGWGMAANPVQAEKWYRRAAVAGNAVAQSIMGHYYRNGVVVKKNPKEAIRWYRMAAEQGESNAQLAIAEGYEKGLGLVKDRYEAIHWYKIAATQGNPRAVEALQRLGGK